MFICLLYALSKHVFVLLAGSVQHSIHSAWLQPGRLFIILLSTTHGIRKSKLAVALEMVKLLSVPLDYSSKLFHAAELLLFGMTIHAHEAKARNLVSRVLPHNEFVVESESIVKAYSELNPEVGWLHHWKYSIALLMLVSD